jgi:methyl-accepting chemotaxis protein
MIKLRNTLVIKFSVIILLILVIGQGILYTWLLLYQRSYLEERLRNEMAAAAEQIAEIAAAKGPGSEILDQFLETLMKAGLIISVKVIDRDGNTTVMKSVPGGGAGDPGSGPSPFSLFYIPRVNTLSVPSDKVSVEVVYSGRQVNEMMKRFLVIPPVMQSLTFALVIYAIVRFFTVKVGKPVELINNALGKVTAGDLTVEVPDVGKDEVASIGSGLRFLIERLSSAILRFNSLSGHVATAMGQLTGTLKSVSDAARKQSAAMDGVISTIRAANDAQVATTENTEKLSHVSSENASSLLEMKSTAEEIALSTGRLFKSTEDSYSMIAEMSQTSQGIAESAAEVSRAVENASASVEEISASLNAVRGNTKESSELTSRVRMLLTDRGTLAVADAISAMEEIADEVNRFAETVNRLDLRSRDIEKVLSVIKEVTEKTNLLSLNAAILAAQAGEYGSGFSVVADEIRALSDRTSSSAREIAGIVGSIRSEINEAVNSIHSGVKKVEEGKDLILRSGEAMGETLEAAQKSAQMAAIVEKATTEQAEGLRQIRLSMENVRVMIDQVAKAIEEERRGSSHMLESISDVKEVAELVKKGTEEHAGGTKVISRNLELTLEMVSQINEAAKKQHSVNKGIIDAVEQMKRAGVAATGELEDVTRLFNSIREEVDVLKKEMEAFKTVSSGKRSGAGG